MSEDLLEYIKNNDGVIEQAWSEHAIESLGKIMLEGAQIPTEYTEKVLLLAVRLTSYAPEWWMQVVFGVKAADEAGTDVDVIQRRIRTLTELIPTASMGVLEGITEEIKDGSIPIDTLEDMAKHSGGDAEAGERVATVLRDRGHLTDTEAERMRHE